MKPRLLSMRPSVTRTSRHDPRGAALESVAAEFALLAQRRARLARQLCWQNKGEDGALPIITLSPDWEQAFAEALIGGGEDKQLALAPSKLQDFIKAVREAFERAALGGEAAVLLTGPQIRPYVRSIIERFRPQTVVMSQNEIHPKARLKTVGMV